MKIFVVIIIVLVSLSSSSFSFSYTSVTYLHNTVAGPENCFMSHPVESQMQRVLNFKGTDATTHNLKYFCWKKNVQDMQCYFTHYFEQTLKMITCQSTRVVCSKSSVN